jgi:hypothetical protein
MTGQILSADSALVMIDKGELGEAENDEIRYSRLTEMVKHFFKDSGMVWEADMYIEVYSGRDGFMVFAENGSGEPLICIHYFSADDLIESMAAYNGTPPRSRLTYYDGEYYLELFGDGDAVSTAGIIFSEFGEEIDHARSLSLELSNNGSVISEDAVAELLYALRRVSD